MECTVNVFITKNQTVLNVCQNQNGRRDTRPVWKQEQPPGYVTGIRKSVPGCQNWVRSRWIKRRYQNPKNISKDEQNVLTGWYSGSWKQGRHIKIRNPVAFTLQQGLVREPVETVTWISILTEALTTSELTTVGYLTSTFPLLRTTLT